MSSPPPNAPGPPPAETDPPLPEPALEEHRDYLLFIAKMQFDERLQSRCDPSDIVNQALLEAHRDRAQRKGDVRAWLRGILAKKIVNAVRWNTADLRDVGREQSLDAAIEDSSNRVCAWLANRDPSPSTQAAAAEERAELMAALVKLPTDQMHAVTYHVLYDLSTRETAERMGRTEASVCGLYSRGLAELRRLMRKRE